MNRSFSYHVEKCLGRAIGLGRHLMLLIACVSVVLEVPATDYGLLCKKSMENTHQMNF